MLEEIDPQLEKFIEPLQVVLENCSCVVLMLAWERIACLPLLPFHLHLRWAGRLPALPLNPKIGIVPFFESDRSVASTPLYRVGEVIQTRRGARALRGSVAHCHSDFVLQDWESKAEKRLVKLGALVLPGASYVAIDQVGLDGHIAYGHRSVLGRIAARGGLRPSVLVAAKRGASAKSASAFGELDLILVSAQGLRGRRAVSSIRAVIGHCNNNVPMLVVASSPSDVLPFAEEAVARHAQFRLGGRLDACLRLAVIPVGRDRPSAEREFEFSVEGLEDRTPAMRDLVQLAKAAWWAVRQATRDPATEPPEARRFFAALDRAVVEIPTDAALLTAARKLLAREGGNRELRAERRRVLVEATLTAPGSSGTLMLARDEDEARELRLQLAAELGLSEASLDELGVHVTGRRGYWPDRPFSAAVAAGYFGARTLDVLLASKAPLLRLVLDPIEARAAWFQAQKIAELLKSAEAADAEAVIRGIAKELSRHVAAFAEVVELSLDPSDLARRIGDDVAGCRPSSPEHVVIAFTDGSALEVSMHARFEVIREAGKRLKTLEATQLEPGDQVVVLREDSRALFSEKLLAALDEGALASQAEKRVTWLSIVQSVCTARRPSAQSIVHAMEELGHHMDLATVRTWLRFDRMEEAAVPERPDRFLAFASALGITLPQETLLDLYSGIQSWRVNHRKFGRELARAVRAAYLGRLDSPTLRKIERDWGLTARQLVEGARVAVIDELILPEGVEDAAD
jgi:hypothetical protein